MPKGEVRKIDGYTAMVRGNPQGRRNAARAERRPHQAVLHLRRLHHARPARRALDEDRRCHAARNTASSRPHGCWTSSSARSSPSSMPTFRIDNSAVLEAIGVKPRGKRDRYSYADIEPGREKLVRTRAMPTSRSRRTSAIPLQTQMHRPRHQPADLRKSVRLVQLRARRRHPARLRQERQLRTNAPTSAPLMTIAPQIRKQVACRRAATSGADPAEPPGPAATGDRRRELRRNSDSSSCRRPIPRTRPGCSAGDAIMDVITEQDDGSATRHR